MAAAKQKLDPDDLNRLGKCNGCDTSVKSGSEECPECGSEDIDQDWNSLLNNYSKHDIGEAYFQGRVEQIGLHVEHWGIDKRHHDDHLIFDNKMDLRLWEPLDGQERAADSWPTPTRDDRIWRAQERSAADSDVEIPSIVSDKANLQRWELRAIADVKTKASESWLGKFNLRHLAHYAEWADHFDVPVFIYMTMVDTEKQSVGDTGFITPIPSDWEWPALIDHYDGDAQHSYGEMKDIARTCPIVHNTFRAPDGNLVVEIASEYRNNWDWFVENVL